MSIELKQAAQQALEALTFIRRKLKSWDRGDSVIDALRTALAQQPATGEPVGQVSDLFPSVRNKLHAKGFDSDAPLYTHPAPSVPEQTIDKICYLATEIRFAKSGDAAQAVIDSIRAMLAAK